MAKEIIVKAEQTSQMLCTELQEAARTANIEGNRAENLLLLDLLEHAVKIRQRLNELF